jgi:hypothetical protein
MRSPQTNNGTAELSISLSDKGKHTAHWTVKGEQGKITINVGKMWDESVERINKWRSHRTGDEIPENEWNNIAETLYISEFIDGIIYSYLMERICLERAFQKLKIKGGRCGKPYRSSCCVAKITESMFAWLEKDIPR